MPININSISSAKGPASALAVDWDTGNFVIIVAKKGIVACGIVDKEVSEKLGFAVAIARGTPDKLLVTANDLMEAKIADITSKAAELGISVGMSGKEALECLQ